MQFLVRTDKKPITLKLVVNTKRPERIRLRVIDKNKANTVYIDRWKTVNGKSPFYIKLPLSPKEAVVQVFNEKNGNKAKGVDKSFWITEQSQEPLETRKECFTCMKDTVYSFIIFACQFAENAGILSAGQSVYYSDDGKFRIDYLDAITDDRGKVLRTPARISRAKGIMQISAAHFRKYTVPRRFAILAHEYSHFYENENQRDEIEADLNGLMIYLALGFPKVEAHQAFLDVFKNSPTDLNVRRHKAITKFIDKFDYLDFKCVGTKSRVDN